MLSSNFNCQEYFVVGNASISLIAVCISLRAVSISLLPVSISLRAMSISLRAMSISLRAVSVFSVQEYLCGFILL